MGIALGHQQYGKAEIRLVHVERSTPRHEIRDLNVTTILYGDFSAAHLAGDNAPILTTDAQKNAVYAFAREHGVDSIEEFALRLARHLASSYEWISGARVEVEEFPWTRIAVAGVEHDHAFERGSGERRTVVATVDGEDAHLIAGLTDLVVLKSTGSEFWGFPRDAYTTLPETRDRILATAVTARWRYVTTDVLPGTYAAIRAAMVETFASLHSLALQQTLYAMGEAALTTSADVAEIRLSMPNKHHFVVDLAPFGLDNPNVVFHADDRPYGKIEAEVRRDDVVAAPAAWAHLPGFC
ncbi:MAG: urate oxidase [Frankiaceae bacterium]|jgi:urate oxidase|nr:urate oxidase [Frankiaceae bacterium]